MKKYPTKLPWAQGELVLNCPKKQNSQELFIFPYDKARKRKADESLEA